MIGYHYTIPLSLKEAIIQAPILCYLDPNKKYTVYTDPSGDVCGAQLLQERDGIEFPIAFLSHMFTETQRKWSTTEQEAYGVYYAVTEWNYYLQGPDIIVQNDHKPLAKFLNGKNANNKVNRWSLELATYNITFEWISGAKNKAANCPSQLVEQLPTTAATVNMLTVTHTDGPASNTRSQTKKDSTGTTPLLHTQMLHLMFPQTQIKHPNLLWQIHWKLYFRCKGQTHSANVFLNVYLMEKHHNTKPDFYSGKRITV